MGNAGSIPANAAEVTKQHNKQAVIRGLEIKAYSCFPGGCFCIELTVAVDDDEDVADDNNGADSSTLAFWTGSLEVSIDCSWAFIGSAMHTVPTNVSSPNALQK